MAVGSWRLNWAIDQMLEVSSFSKHQAALNSHLQFWRALALKIIPKLWTRPVHMKLKNGGEFLVHEFMTLYIYKEIFIDGCYDHPRLAHEAPTIIDVGANTGLFAIRMKQLYPSANVHCYEPMPENFQSLRTNLAMSKFNLCTTHLEGVGGLARNEKLYIHKKNLGGHSIYQGIASDKFVDIQLIDLHSALDRLNGKHCDLLKLDCEGAELEIIKSMDASVAERIQHIVLEPTPSKYHIDEVITPLTSLGYKVRWNEGLCIAERA